MASLPPQQLPRRSPPVTRNATSINDTEEASSSSIEQKDLESSTTSDFTFADAASVAEDPLQATATAVTEQQSRRVNTEEPRRCWICFSDETEDTSESGIWRQPCPCNLVAHEPCLLQWIADIEAPKAGRSTAAPADIRCPQCKAKIYLARPRSYIGEAVGTIEKYTGKALLPAVLLGTGYSLILGMSHHGAHTIRMLFGAEEAERMLAPLPPMQWSQFERYAMANFPNIAWPFFRHWRGFRVELGLPLIPAALVASRTRLADAILPILPIVFFASHPKTSESLSIGYWPPSAALTFVVLPYFRSAYDEYMKRVWSPHERRWLAEVKPRLGEEPATAQNDGAEVADAGDAEDADVMINIGLNWADDDEEEEVVVEEDEDTDDDEMPELEDIPIPDVQQAPALHAPPQDDLVHALHAHAEARRQLAEFIGADEGPAVRRQVRQLAELEARREAEEDANALPPQQAQPAPAPAPAQPVHQHRRHEIDLLASARRVAESIMGALLYPTVAAGCGELLRLLLPLTWTVATKRLHIPPNSNTYAATGLLDRLLWGFGRSNEAGARSGGETRIVPTGLLQTKWGRSVVGGCLFVVVKDMVRVYCRWRMAVSFRERRIRDWDRKKGRLVD